MLNIRLWTMIGIVFVAAAMRVVPHSPNVTPIAAMALFGGAYLADKKLAFAVPLAAMFLSDMVLGFFVYDLGWFHPVMPFVYGSVALTVGLGLWVREHRSPLRIGAAAVTSSVLFFLITNFGVWLVGSHGLYPKTVEGLAACYLAAIPFFRNILVGDAVYTLLLFGGYALLQRYLPALREEPVPVMARM